MLITGFAPFGGEPINPSWEAVKALPEQIGEYRLIKLEVPVVYGLAGQTVLERAAVVQPDAILCIGQAAGRSAVTPEYVAINLRHANIPDNAGYCAMEKPIVEGGPDAYFSTMPVVRIREAIQKAGIPSAVSFSAGAFVCNDLLYTLLHHYAGTAMKAGFIHVPLLPQQAKNGMPSLGLDEICRALNAAIQCL